MGKRKGAERRKRGGGRERREERTDLKFFYLSDFARKARDVQQVVDLSPAPRPPVTLFDDPDDADPYLLAPDRTMTEDGNLKEEEEEEEEEASSSHQPAQLLSVHVTPVTYTSPSWRVRYRSVERGRGVLIRTLRVTETAGPGRTLNRG
eukprot:763736-Hanusia_phi.AAC.5